MTVPAGQKASMHGSDITGDECYTCLIVDTLTLPHSSHHAVAEQLITVPTKDDRGAHAHLCVVKRGLQGNRMGHSFHDRMHAPTLCP